MDIPKLPAGCTELDPASPIGKIIIPLLNKGNAGLYDKLTTHFRLFLPPVHHQKMTPELIQQLPLTPMLGIYSVGQLRAGIQLPLYDAEHPLFYQMLSYSQCGAMQITGNGARVVSEWSKRAQDDTNYPTAVGETLEKDLFTFKAFTEAYSVSPLLPNHGWAYKLNKIGAPAKRLLERVGSDPSSKTMPGAKNKNFGCHYSKDDSWNSYPLLVWGPHAYGWEDAAKTQPRLSPPVVPDVPSAWCPFAFDTTLLEQVNFFPCPLFDHAYPATSTKAPGFSLLPPICSYWSRRRKEGSPKRLLKLLRDLLFLLVLPPLPMAPPRVLLLPKSLPNLPSGEVLPNKQPPRNGINRSLRSTR